MYIWEELKVCVTNAPLFWKFLFSGVEKSA